jgi:hypothetical protein
MKLRRMRWVKCEAWMVEFKIDHSWSSGFLETSAEQYFAHSVIFSVKKPLPV